MREILGEGYNRELLISFLLLNLIGVLAPRSPNQNLPPTFQTIDWQGILYTFMYKEQGFETQQCEK